MELQVNRPHDRPAVVDFRRFVLMVGHRFDDRITFWSELELEHAAVEGLEEKGELELEQAYLDVRLNRYSTLRAGMVLVPVGLINERHEPPTFHGVERPFVDTLILPSTWHDAAIGVVGDLGRGLTYKAYLMPGLDALAFDAKEGIREGRQQGALAVLRRAAVSGRLEYRNSRGLRTGASLWRGSGGAVLARFDPPVTVSSADARYRRGRAEARAQLGYVAIARAGELNDAIQLGSGINPNIARALLGVYGELAWRVTPDSWVHEIVPFGRYERFDTQFRMPEGYLPLESLKRSAWVVGASYFPDPDIAFKFDYTHQRSLSSVVPAPRSLNFGIGWWF